MVRINQLPINHSRGRGLTQTPIVNCQWGRDLPFFKENLLPSPKKCIIQNPSAIISAIVDGNHCGHIQYPTPPHPPKGNWFKWGWGGVGGRGPSVFLEKQPMYWAMGPH